MTCRRFIQGEYRNVRDPFPGMHRRGQADVFASFIWRRYLSRTASPFSEGHRERGQGIASSTALLQSGDTTVRTGRVQGCSAAYHSNDFIGRRRSGDINVVIVGTILLWSRGEAR